jgi:AmmeMemoRadiSam system protein B
MKKLNSSVAGIFYPNDPKALRQIIDKLLAETSADNKELKLPKAIIAPHAGFSCSGATAAAVYACLAKYKKEIKRVVLFGPAHRYPFYGLAVTETDYFATPLGDIPIDKDAVIKALDLSQVKIVNEAYHGENSLEVQLPFLQVVLDEFKIVPVLIGEANNEQIVEVLESLWYGKETLIIISTDLSHYLDYESAQRIDDITINAILSLSPQKIEYEQACGRKAINALLTVAARKELQSQLIAACNSGDTVGDRSSVVGYAGFHFR